MDSSPYEDEDMIFYSTESAETFDYNKYMECLEECELNGLNVACVFRCFMKPAHIMSKNALFGAS
jgi:hypothetical protein